jgi:hypothetical protein
MKPGDLVQCHPGRVDRSTGLTQKPGMMSDENPIVGRLQLDQLGLVIAIICYRSSSKPYEALIIAQDQIGWASVPALVVATGEDP